MARRNPKEDSETPRTVNLVCESDMDSWSLSPALIQRKNQTQILKRVERQTLLLSITKVQSDRVSSLKNTGISLETALAWEWAHSDTAPSPVDQGTVGFVYLHVRCRLSHPELCSYKVFPVFLRAPPIPKRSFLRQKWGRQCYKCSSNNSWL